MFHFWHHPFFSFTYKLCLLLGLFCQLSTGSSSDVCTLTPPEDLKQDLTQPHNTKPHSKTHKLTTTPFFLKLLNHITSSTHQSLEQNPGVGSNRWILRVSALYSMWCVTLIPLSLTHAGRLEIHFFWAAWWCSSLQRQSKKRPKQTFARIWADVGNIFSVVACQKS